MSEPALILIGRDEVRQHLDLPSCIALMREAMIALSTGRTQQLLRSVIDLGGSNAFGVMPGAMGDAGFGAKLVSVFPHNLRYPKQSHQGLIALFDAASGAPVCLVHGGEVTAIRTAAASAAATDVLARSDARTLAILGYGEQAWQHALAIRHVRPIERLSIWGRDIELARLLAQRIYGALGLPTVAATSVEQAVADADIICTTTAATDPILFSRQVADGAHLNVVGSSRPGPVEIDSALVVRSRFFADHREGVLRQGAEFIRARDAGLIDERHVLGEIGEVMTGVLAGRQQASDVTLYKSLGSIVQDLACASFLYAGALKEGFGARVPFG